MITALMPRKNYYPTFKVEDSTVDIVGFPISKATMIALVGSRTLSTLKQGSGQPKFSAIYKESLRTFVANMDADELADFKAFELVECASAEGLIPKERRTYYETVAREDYAKAELMVVMLREARADRRATEAQVDARKRAADAKAAERAKAEAEARNSERARLEAQFRSLRK